MVNKAGLIRATGVDPEQVAKQLRGEGWVVFVLPSDISDKAALFEAMRTILPMDPPLVGSRSWDALSDSLWGGIDQLGEERVAIIWPKAQLKPVSDLDTALAVLEGVALSLSDPKATDENPKEVSVVVT
jgi:hypothetical protein